MSGLLGRGDRLPRMVVAPPGPLARTGAARLAAHEAPGVNTLYRGEPAIQWAAARGANVLDTDGNRYLDLTSGFGVAAIGHRHPRVVSAVRRQAGVLLHGLGDVHAHPQRLALAARLCALAPMADARVYFAISGAEAVEVALETALLATGRRRVVAFHGAYHGLTLGALALTARAAFRAPFRPALNPHVEHLPFAAPPALLAAALADDDVAAVVVEPILGREGIVLPPAGWLAALAAVCARHGTLLVADEILTGGGRTGSFWACAAEGVTPDLVCCGKALGGGLPFAAVLARAPLMAAWASDGEALHTATFLAHPLACAAAVAALDVLAEERLVERARALGRTLAARLGDWPGRFVGRVTAVRGRGAMWGVELASAAAAAAFVAAALGRGVILLAGGESGRVAQLLPPLAITDRQLEDALGRLELALGS